MSQTGLVPAPRAGLLGEWDKFIGPGATRAEVLLMLAAAIGGTAIVLLHAISQELAWPPLGAILVAIIAFDIFGGVAANASNATKRWYHRPGQTARSHLIFAAAHIIHPVLAMLAVAAGHWFWALAGYGYLMLAALAIVAAPRYLQRPLAVTLVVFGILLSLYVLGTPAGLEWLLPALYLKILSGHMVPDAIYASESGGTHG
jgi:hypothetical protein